MRVEAKSGFEIFVLWVSVVRLERLEFISLFFLSLFQFSVYSCFRPANSLHLLSVNSESALNATFQFAKYV